MADPKPYVLRRYDHGAYTVHDRQTGEKVGRVLYGYNGWEASDGPDEHCRLIAHAESRAAAAERLWETRP
jgi:hypothetical protein